MADSKLTHALNAMTAGDGFHSYIRNSSYQGVIVDVSNPIIEEEIATNLDLSTGLNGSICIADFGCSTGHNSFPTMQIITQAIKRNIFESSSSGLVTAPEFLVFFNDTAANDFNTLFGSLPPDRLYSAVGVPGDFHGRLLQRSSLHFVYSSWSLHWLKEVPRAVVDRDSPAWNGGRVTYSKERKEVCDAYLDQYSRDMESFLESRSVEMVGGGLMAFMVPGVLQWWNPETEYTLLTDLEILGDCLVDMVNKGKLSESIVDSFNFPHYFTTPQQMKAILEGIQSFTIERMEILDNLQAVTLTLIPSPRARAAAASAIYRTLLTYHFGSELTDELFELYSKKIEASPVFKNPENNKTIIVLVILKRRVD